MANTFRIPTVSGELRVEMDTATGLDFTSSNPQTISTDLSDVTQALISTTVNDGDFSVDTSAGNANQFDVQTATATGDSDVDVHYIAVSAV